MAATEPPLSSPIRTLLIANRGEIARRIQRTAHEMGIRTVAVYAESDRLAPHVLEADVSVPLKGSSAADTYLNRDELLRAAEWQGADAVHPGYGFLSERASFARAVLKAGLTWVGPPPDAITAMGDKLVAKQAAAEAGVPTLPWAFVGGEDPDRWIAEVAHLRYPLLVKAAAGGGGRGMRVVAEPSAMAEAVRSARREAGTSFGNATVFVEQWVPAGRHIEIQVLADAYGEAIHLGERECSIQRRHQKLIEETPSTAVSPELREAMAAAALTLARSIAYVGPGTVEFLLEDGSDSGDGASDPQFWFLEMNTRLQVEHPVTEMITGLDLVRLQLMLAQGMPLPMQQHEVQFDGHAIEARICAEDPAAGWLPSVGTLHRWEPGPTPGVRYDSGVVTGSIVSPHFDSLLAKAIVHAPTRSEATARLARALREVTVHGVTTNREYLYDALVSPDFAAGATCTDFVDRNPPISDWPDDDSQPVERQWQRFNAITGPHLAAAALVGQRRRRRASPVAFAPVGWRNVGGQGKELRPGEASWRLLDAPAGYAAQSVSFQSQGHDWHLTYSRLSRDHPLERERQTEASAHPGSVELENLFNVAIEGPAGNTTTLVELVAVAGATDGLDATVLVHFGRRGHRCAVHIVGNTYYVNSPLGQSVFVEHDRFVEGHDQVQATDPVAPVPGRIVSIDVSVGDSVSRGDVLLVMEAMKVEHRITAPADSVVVEILVGAGASVDAHQLLVRLDPIS